MCWDTVHLKRCIGSEEKTCLATGIVGGFLTASGTWGHNKRHRDRRVTACPSVVTLSDGPVSPSISATEKTTFDETHQHVAIKQQVIKLGSAVHHIFQSGPGCGAWVGGIQPSSLIPCNDQVYD